MQWRTKRGLNTDWPQHQEAALEGLGGQGEGPRPWEKQRVGLYQDEHSESSREREALL